MQTSYLGLLYEDWLTFLVSPASSINTLSLSHKSPSFFLCLDQVYLALPQVLALAVPPARFSVADSLSLKSLFQYHMLSGTFPNNINNFILVPSPLTHVTVFYFLQNIRNGFICKCFYCLLPILPLYQQCPKQCLARSRCSMNICWMNDFYDRPFQRWEGLLHW